MGTAASRRPRACLILVSQVMIPESVGEAYRASSQLIGFSVMLLVVGRLSIAHHGHDVRERSTGTVVLVGVEENAQTFKSICRSEHGTGCGTVLGEPERKSVTVEVARSVDFELEFNLSPSS